MNFYLHMDLIPLLHILLSRTSGNWHHKATLYNVIPYAGPPYCETTELIAYLPGADRLHWKLEGGKKIEGSKEGAGGETEKYIFKDNLEANIIFILIYPHSTIISPKTCLMRWNCKMAMSSTYLASQWSLSSHMDLYFSTMWLLQAKLL